MFVIAVKFIYVSPNNKQHKYRVEADMLSQFYGYKTVTCIQV